MLEIQLKGARRGAGGLTRGGGTQGRANIEAEKEVKKQMKEMEVHTYTYMFLSNTCLRVASLSHTFIVYVFDSSCMMHFVIFTRIVCYYCKLGCCQTRKTCIRKTTSRER